MTDKKCLMCLETRKISEFYMTSNSHYFADGKIPICKTCLRKDVDVNDIEANKELFMIINKPLIIDRWEGAKTKDNLLGEYFRILASKDYRYKTFSDSDISSVLPQNQNSATDNQESISLVSDEIELEKKTIEDKNKQDVLRMVGYDPFEFDSPEDKRLLYNRLVDFLDESTLDDGFKLSAVIEIVKGYFQVDKLNNAISALTSDPNFSGGNIATLVSTKQKILTSLLSLAKDNGISVNHNNTKSKGSGTLSGIMKELKEKDFQEATVNLFDVETSMGMRQVADLSSEAIIKQLQFDENDYTEMIAEQREMLDKQQLELSKAQEENRLLKIQLGSMGVESLDA